MASAAVKKRVANENQTPTSPNKRTKHIEEDQENEDKPATRYVLFPIQSKEVWKMYKKHLASFWTVDELKLAGDLKDWDNLTSDEQHFIKHVLAFFAAADGIVNENLVLNWQLKSVYSLNIELVMN